METSVPFPEKLPLDSKPQKTLKTNSSYTILEPIMPKFSKKISKKVYKKVRCFYAKKYPSGVCFASFQAIALPPTNFSNTTHRIEGDFFLRDPSSLKMVNEISIERGLLADFNSCKKIMSCTYEKLLKCFQFKLQSFETPFTPVEVLSQKFDSSHDQEAQDLAQKLRFYAQKLEMFKQAAVIGMTPTRNDSQYKDFQKCVGKNQLIFSKDAYVITLKSCIIPEKNRFEVAEIWFNENFVRMLGLSSEEFITQSLKKGFPDIIHISGNYYKWFANLLDKSKNLGSNKKDLSLFVDFIGDDKEKPIKCQIEVEDMIFISENYREFIFMIVCVPNKKGLSLKTSFYSRNQQPEAKEFFKMFYPEYCMKK